MLKLPDLQARLPIVGSDGLPSTAFLRYWHDVLRAIELNEANQEQILADFAAAQAQLAAQQLEIIAVQDTQQDEIDRLNRVLAGTEVFTGLNVNGQDVATFLDTTDGAQIIDPSGLGPQVVSTTSVVPGAITQGSSAFSGGTIAWAGTGETIAQTLNVTTSGGIVDVTTGISFSASGTSPINSYMSIVRDGVALFGPFIMASSYAQTSFTDQVVDQTVTVSIVDQPSAGAHTYELYFSYGSTGGPRNCRNRYINVREQKTDV